MKTNVTAFAAIAACAVSSAASASVLVANPGPANNGGSAGWGMFFDVTAGAAPIELSHMTTASDASAGAGYSIEFFIRSGSGLGGPVGAGPGSSSAGWTSVGIASVTQGAISSGVSELFAIPSILVGAGDTVGIAMIFSSAGPRYFDGGTTSYGDYSDGNLSLSTGDTRTSPFNSSGLWFSSRELVGEIHYSVIPTPGSLAVLGIAGLVGIQRRRR